MKNIHVLPTDKPSSLLFEKLSNRYYTNSRRKENSKNVQNQNIYITSDEEIREGDWFYIPNQMIGYEHISNEWSNDLDTVYAKKIILTTDELYIHNDLIPKEYNPFPQYIQKIDDEFLEWFVKNPSCEEVEVEKGCVLYDFKYKIIIPKEEPKQESFVERMKPLQEQWQQDMYKELMKKETLEEAAEKYVEINVAKNVAKLMYKEHFIAGAKWQQEQDKNKWSYKEVEELLISCKDRFGGSELQDYTHDDRVKEWFKQFKKK